MTQTPTDALRLVPVEPTRGMMDAANRVDWTNEDERATIINIWQAMLAAAPASPMPGGGLEPLSDDPAVASMCDSSYRAGALAGWNAAHHSDPEEGERIMSRIRSVEPGSLAPIVERNRARQQVREYDFKAEDEWFEPLPAAPTGEPK